MNPIQPDSLKSWTGTPPESWDAYYVRVTQAESVKAELSIPNQIARARELANERRPGGHFRIYLEPKHVGGKLWIDQRAALRELVQDITAGRVRRVTARHTDRLWRGPLIQERLLSIFSKYQVELWDFTSQRDYKSAHGRFSLQVLGAASEYELNISAERIREMKRGKAQKGKTGGGPPPYGYTCQSRRILEQVNAGIPRDEAYRCACLDYPIGKSWYVDEKEAEVVRLIYEFYTSSDNRMGFKRIARLLNVRGIKGRNGFSWFAQAVARIVNNPAYAGFTTFDEQSYRQQVPSQRPRHLQERYAGEHPQLIPEELWLRAQQIKTQENDVLRTRDSSTEQRVFSLTGILRCPKCECRMIGKWSNRSSRSYYICNRRHGSGPEECDVPLLNAGQLHAQVWQWVHELLTSPQFLLQHLQRLTKQMKSELPETEKRSTACKRRHDDLKAALAKYYALFEASRDPAQDAPLLERVRELKAELHMVEEELLDSSKKAAPLPKRLTEVWVREYLAKLRAQLDVRPEAQRTLYHHLKREHGFCVNVISKEIFAISIQLPLSNQTAKNAGATRLSGTTRLYAVGSSNKLGPGITGLPVPGAPTIKRL